MNHLIVGMIVPDFVLPSLEGVPVALSSLRGRKVLLSLLRNAQCCLFNLWVHRAEAQAERWRQ